MDDESALRTDHFGETTVRPLQVVGCVATYAYDRPLGRARPPQFGVPSPSIEGPTIYSFDAEMHRTAVRGPIATMLQEIDDQEGGVKP
jgi:hypothetical protein